MKTENDKSIGTKIVDNLREKLNKFTFTSPALHSWPMASNNFRIVRNTKNPIGATGLLTSTIWF